MQAQVAEAALALDGAREGLRQARDELQTAHDELAALAVTDPLTGLPNHRALVTALEQELERAQRYHHPCAVLFVDLDHFKALNDGYGHAAGDAALRELGVVVRSCLRNIDIIGRWGGEEFLALLPETNEEAALKTAERIRSAIAAHIFSAGGGMHLTSSLGVAVYPNHALDRSALVAAADLAMYVAKKLGRNQTRSASDPTTVSLEAEKRNGSREEAALTGAVDSLTMLLEARDSYTGEHTSDAALLALQLALALGLDTTEARMISLAGRLHDLGKVAIPDAILQKPAPLTEEEWKLMRTHPIIGADVVSRMPSLRVLAPIIRSHHERWDGHGYPDQLSGEAIPLGARIIAVVDAYSAMTTNRPYRKAHNPAWALRELQRCAGTQFDPQVVAALELMLSADLAPAISVA